MAEYKIEAVAPETKPFSGKYGEMISYKVKLPNTNDPVEVVQKESTPPPKAGDVLNGTIESSEFGPKFKKDFQAKSGGFGGSKPMADPYTMYLSYAKDIAIACIVVGKFSPTLYTEMLEAVSAGGAQLFASRPEAQDKQSATTVDKVFPNKEPLPEPPADEPEIDWNPTSE